MFDARNSLVAVAAIAWLIQCGQPLPAQTQQAIEIMPATVVAYGQLEQPEKFYDELFSLPIWERLESLPNYDQIWKSEGGVRAQKLKTALEEAFHCEWQQAIAKLAGEGVHLGFDLPTQGVVMLLDAKDHASAEVNQQQLIRFLDLLRTENAEVPALESKKHREIAYHAIGDKAAFAVYEKYLVVTNKPNLLRLVLNTAIDQLPSLASEEQFAKVFDKREKSSPLWAYADLRLLRATGALKKAIPNKSDNPVVELVAGGILSALPDTSFVTVSSGLKDGRFSLSVQMPYDRESVAKKKRYYVGEAGTGQAPALLTPPGTLLSLSTYRDLVDMWRNAPDLFDEGINAKLVEAESGLSTLFAGRNFRDEILANLEPEIQLVVARQSFPVAGITPGIRLPAIAMAMKMRNEEETTRIFKVTFQSVIGFLNVVGGMNGLTPLDLNSERGDGRVAVWAEYFPPKDESQRVNAAPQYNATPALIMDGKHVVLSSSRELAELLMGEVVQSKPGETSSVNTNLVFDASASTETLSENRDPLIAQNMLEKGHPRPNAENEIDALLLIASFFRDAKLELLTPPDQITLQVEVGFSEAK